MTLCPLKSFYFMGRRRHSLSPLTIARHTYSNQFKDAIEGSNQLLDMDMKDLPPERIRNFSIIAHIDHGKSTLADRLLELAGVITKNRGNCQVLDKLQVERMRGITIKAQTASVLYYPPTSCKAGGALQGKPLPYLFNLIDTPGHVDFSYEVSRSLAACQGALLLVDASQGIQAQTMAHFWLAFTEGLAVLPILNKVDLSTADIEGTINQIMENFDLPRNLMVPISAKTGFNCEKIMESIVTTLPRPPGCIHKNFRALLFDSYYDPYRGVVCYFSIIDGYLAKGDQVQSAETRKVYTVVDLGIMSPEEVSKKALYAGQVGYVVLNIRSVKETFIGDTFHRPKETVESLPGFKRAKQMVFAGVYPAESEEHELLRDALEKLTLNDRSVSMTEESNSTLGRGWRLGFLGTLHMDVFKQRLEQEYSTSIIFTAPTVSYILQTVKGNREKMGNPGGPDAGQVVVVEKVIQNMQEFPDVEDMAKLKNACILEPYITATIIIPEEYIGGVLTLCMEHRGTQKSINSLDTKRTTMVFELPLSEVVVDFYDSLKSITSGYASFDYEESGYQRSDVVKICAMLNGKIIPDLSLVTHRSKSVAVGKHLVSRLKELVPRQQFEVAIQAVIGRKVIARETIKQYRKDVTAKLYGGDITRRMKLLERQKEGKKKLKMLGNIQLSPDVFIGIVRSDVKGNT